jgi:hypothetical protein
VWEKPSVGVFKESATDGKTVNRAVDRILAVREKRSMKASKLGQQVTGRNQRENRFPGSQENEGGNLFTRTFELLVKRRYADAEANLDLELSLNPLSGEAILSWAELKMCQRELLAVIDKVSPLASAYPTNAYYFLSQVLLVLEDWDLRSVHGIWRYDEYMALVAECGGGSADVFAKMALASIRRGMWKPGMSYFIEAIQAKEREHNGPADLIFLCEKNEDDLERYLDRVLVLEDEPPERMIELIVKTICILLIAYEDLGIAEAWPAAVMLANRSWLVAESWNELSFLFGRCCPHWVQIERTDGQVPLVRARMDDLVASQLIC